MRFLRVGGVSKTAEDEARTIDRALVGIISHEGREGVHDMEGILQVPNGRFYPFPDHLR
jgi:hypothetical protein